MINVLLLLALPASGKSEVRRYIESLPERTAASEMRLGRQIHVDDYPYVHLMRRVCQEQRRLGIRPTFFETDSAPFNDPHDWLTLIHLINGDIASVGGQRDGSAAALLGRVEAARSRAGVVHPTIEGREALASDLSRDAEILAAELPSQTSNGQSTIVIEFARGGPEGASAPLPAPLGYQHSLNALSDDILDEASILYVSTTPEESRRRNRERAIPGEEASILHHAVPEEVLIHSYGMDDMDWLRSQQRVPGTIPVGDHDVPTAVFDNRIDRTSFLRLPKREWPAESVTRLHVDLAEALQSLGDESHR